MSVQIIKQKGKPEWAVLPYEDYLQLVEQAEMLEDIEAYDSVMKAINDGTEELFPDELVKAMIDGKNPVKLWREYRKLTQKKLAEAISISVPFLSQIETGKRKPSVEVLVKMASVLHIDIDFLLMK